MDVNWNKRIMCGKMHVIGWFDAFRENGDPTWFGDNRTPVVFDLQIFGLTSVFVTPLIAFLVIVPGVRRHRLASTVTFTFSMVVGAIILVTLHHPCWHEGSLRISSVYKAFTNERMDAVLGVRMGLNHVNVTLTAVSATNDRYGSSPLAGLEYNERFEFLNVFSMERELENSLRKGLPYPILKVIEYLSVDRAGFVWGRQYRLSGYYTLCMLWTAFGLWLIEMLVLCLVPHYFCVMVVTVGTAIVLSDLIYFIFLPRHLRIRFPAADGVMSVLEFHLSACFYATLIAGLTSVLFGCLLWFLQAKSIYTLQTFMSCNIDEHCCGFKRRRNRKKQIHLDAIPSHTPTGSIVSVYDERF
uniref:DUOXA-like protein n=3 Tax=Parascaris TaxID=6254 RepID=A0A915C0F6_PARUN